MRGVQLCILHKAHAMHALFSLLNTPVGTAAHVRRAGMATLCRLACAAAEAGRTAVIVTRSRAEFAEARALAALLTPSLFFIIGLIFICFSMGTSSKSFPKLKILLSISI